MKKLWLSLVVLAVMHPLASSAQQVHSGLWEAPSIASPLALENAVIDPSWDVEMAVRRVGIGVNPLIRTVLMIAASTGGYYLGEQNFEEDDGEDLQFAPIAIGAGAGALTGIVLSSGSPVKIILGSALATLPAAALSTFVEGSLEEGENEDLPTYLFGVTHGLFASAFAQNR